MCVCFSFCGVCLSINGVGYQVNCYVQVMGSIADVQEEECRKDG